jgi:hypothetical protein
MKASATDNINHGLMENVQNNKMKGSRLNCNGCRIPSQINGHNLNNVRCETSRNFRNKKEGISEKNIRDI